MREKQHSGLSNERFFPWKESVMNQWAESSVLRGIQALLPPCLEKDLFKSLTNTDPHQEERNKNTRFQRERHLRQCYPKPLDVFLAYWNSNSRRKTDTNKIEGEEWIGYLTECFLRATIPNSFWRIHSTSISGISIWKGSKQKEKHRSLQQKSELDKKKEANQRSRR